MIYDIVASFWGQAGSGVWVRSRMGASYEANSFRSAREHCIAHSRRHLGSFGHDQYGCRGHYGPKLLRRLRGQRPHLASAPEIERTRASRSQARPERQRCLWSTYVPLCFVIVVRLQCLCRASSLALSRRHSESLMLLITRSAGVRGIGRSGSAIAAWQWYLRYDIVFNHLSERAYADPITAS
jgi:hypothetical protein